MKPLHERSITPASKEWPRLLSETGRPPNRLFLSGGELDPMSAGVAIVGTRHPTVAGIETARSLARALAQAGFVVISGLAEGIDAASHWSALEAGGTTIAVVGAGLDVDYPRANRRLRSEIEMAGTVVSEYPPGTEPRPYQFPQRNRIIAGMAVATVVVEGGERSGALITARYALEANRSVFAVPGSVRNPMAAGPNSLIKRMEASALTVPEDLFEDLAPTIVMCERAGGPSPAVTEEEGLVLSALDDVAALPARLEKIVSLQPGRLSMVLSRLEVKGYAARDGGGYLITGLGVRAREALQGPRA